MLTTRELLRNCRSGRRIARNFVAMPDQLGGSERLSTSGITGSIWERHLVSGPVRFQQTIRFGEDFELDVQSYKLRRDGRVLKLERIPMEILLLLIEQRGRIVSREDIVEKIWGKDVFLDTDNSINGAIRKIRQVLRDDSEQPQFIQTISGQGYRFIAQVVEPVSVPVALEEPPTNGSQHGQAAGVEQDGLRTKGDPAGAVETPSPAANARSRRPIWAVVGALTLITAVASVGWALRHRTAAAQPSPARIMLAVLPFQNLTGDSTQDYFSDGLTEEMISQLGNLDPQRLGIIARTSVMHYKNTQTSLGEISRELGVQYVIEGSVRQDGESVRVTAQLIRTNDQSHVWVRQYDRQLKGLFTLEGEIAEEIADEIQLTLGNHKLSSAQAVVSPQNYQAYDLYLKGQYFLNKRTIPGLKQAVEYFEQATSKDPNYARAYAGLADCYALMGGYTGLPQTEFIPKARAAAVRALQLDDSIPEAHTALALIVQNYDWDWQTAEKEFRRAIDLNPNYATAHHWYAEHLMWRGRFDEALQESEKARQLDPLSLIIAADNGAILYFSRDYDRAIEKWRSVLEMDADFRRAHLIRAAYLEKGLFADSIADIEKMRPLDPVPDSLSWLANIYGRSGQTVQSRAALRELLNWNRKHASDPMLVAWAYAGLGDKNEAFACLDKAYAQHSNELVSLKVNPGYDQLRGDPRFKDLLRRIRLD